MKGDVPSLTTSKCRRCTLCKPLQGQVFWYIEMGLHSCLSHRLHKGSDQTVSLTPPKIAETPA